MKRLRFVVSLTTTENDYQMEQSKAAEEAGRKLGVDVQLIYADNDTITQIFIVDGNGNRTVGRQFSHDHAQGWAGRR